MCVEGGGREEGQRVGCWVDSEHVFVIVLWGWEHLLAVVLYYSFVGCAHLYSSCVQ